MLTSKPPKIERVRLVNRGFVRPQLGQTQPTQPTLYEAIQAAAPAIVGLSRQYQRAAPLIDWLIDHPGAAVAVFLLSLSGAAFLGASLGVRYWAPRGE